MLLKEYKSINLQGFNVSLVLLVDILVFFTEN